jgi:hypothetical protein
MKRLILLGALGLALSGCRDSAGSAASLSIEVPAQAVAGELFTVAVTARDSQGRVVREVSGPVKLKTDAASNLPRDLAFDTQAAGRLVLPVRILQAGSHRFQVEAAGLKATSNPVAISAAAAASLRVDAGDGQSGMVGAALPQPLTVLVQDAFGNAVGAGTQVTFAAPSGGAVDPGQGVTDGNGKVSIRGTLGPVAGAQHFTARLASGAQADFVETAGAGAAAGVRLVSGDGQVAAPGAALALPLVAQVIDASGNGVAGATVLWTATGGAQVTPSRSTSDATGLVQATGTLPATPVNVTFTAALGTSTVLFHAAPTGFSYGDPPSGQGPVRLELVGPGSVAGSLRLRLVATQPLSGYTIGFDLPLHDPTTTLVDFTPGAALPAGASPVAARCVIATSGPLAGQLVTAQSQKRAGTGAVAGDTAIPAGAVFYTVTLAPGPTATPGVIFDGAAIDAGLQAGLLSFTGSEVVGTSGFAIGRLELH